eukprot:c4185_g1_i1.p1 GENE.c4185_g1_i1~~c4185_g1_i1.p1  ORF type:complete len:400 (-),score=94.68 c4185_g1_i1:167-1366(-)
MLMVTVLGSITLNALDVSRTFSLFSTFFVLLCIVFNTATYYIADPACFLEADKVWPALSHRMSRLEVKRLIFLELLILLTSSVYIRVRDRSQRFISFPIGVVVKKRQQPKRLNGSSLSSLTLTSNSPRHASPAPSAFSFSSWIFSSNHLAELVSLLIGFVALIMFMRSAALWPSFLGIVAVLICVLFVIKGNMDYVVLRLVLSQFPVLVILLCCALNIVWNFVVHTNVQDKVGGVMFFMTVLLSICLDSVRIVSRMFRVSVCLAVATMCLYLLFSSILYLDSCLGSSGSSVSLPLLHDHQFTNTTQLKRTIAFVIVFTHIRPWYLLLFKSNKHTLYFVTTRVQKKFVLEHQFSEGGGVHLCFGQTESEHGYSVRGSVASVTSTGSVASATGLPLLTSTS